MNRKKVENHCSWKLSTRLSICNTGGPRYSRSFYLRFRLFAIKESIPKFGIRGLSLAYSQFLIVFYTKYSFKKAFWDHPVLPRYSRFQNMRCFARTYLPRIKTAAPKCIHIFICFHTLVALLFVMSYLSVGKNSVSVRTLSVNQLR